MKNSGQENEDNDSSVADEEATAAPRKPDRQREIGGRNGPDPTRFGDWEKNGRCIDF